MRTAIRVSSSVSGPATLPGPAAACPDLPTADAYATAAFAMGLERGPHWTARLPRGFEALTILADETLLATGGFPHG